MVNSTERPRTGPPPNVTADIELLEELLAIERERLQTAVRIERDRSIVFPETSVIIHDIQKLRAAINRAPAAASQEPPAGELELLSKFEL